MPLRLVRALGKFQRTESRLLGHLLEANVFSHIKHPLFLLSQSLCRECLVHQQRDAVSNERQKSPRLLEKIPKAQKTAREKTDQGVSNPFIKNETEGGQKAVIKAAEDDPGCCFQGFAVCFLLQ